MKSNTSSTLIGNAACFGAYLIFGFNIIFCKNIADSRLVSPMALYLMRAIGALALFWIFSLYVKDDPTEGSVPTAKGTRTLGGIELRDLWKVALASFLGLFLTQLSFLKAITMTTARTPKKKKKKDTVRHGFITKDAISITLSTGWIFSTERE